jgi:hypothetical protein
MSQSDPTFAAFYAAYLADHRHPVNRALHLLAKLLAVGGIAAAAVARNPLLLLAVPVLAVAPCWLGHLLFEGNRPVSWTRPSASLLGALGGWLLRLGQLGQLGRFRGPAADWPAPGPANQGRPSRPLGGRAYYSFLADLRMCAGMLTGRDAAGVTSDLT